MIGIVDKVNVYFDELHNFGQRIKNNEVFVLMKWIAREMTFIAGLREI